MAFQIKYHFIPCFWSALWNEEFYIRFLDGETPKARVQPLYTLNIPGKKIFKTTAENVFYDKYTGLADLKNDEVIRFAEKYFPMEKIEFSKDDPDNYFMDFENFFPTMEDLQKPTLFEIIKKQRIETLKEKTEIGFFIVDMQFRNHTHFNHLLQEHEKSGRPKFEFFWLTKQHFSNPEFLATAVLPLVTSEWTLYVSDTAVFPLGDVPVIPRSNEIVVPLSPLLLLQINLTKKIPLRKLNDASTKMCYTKKVSRSVEDKHRHLTINHAKREIVFHDNDILAQWQHSPTFKKCRF
jgi:hypothetical protein